MMEPLLRHLVAITAHRDHTLLNVSAISALQALLAPHSIRLLDILALHGRLFLRPRTWLQDGTAISCDNDYSGDSALEPASAHPALAQSLAERTGLVDGISPDGKTHYLWLPVWLNDTPVLCIEMSSDTPFSMQARAVAEGIFCVYSNFHSLLDYSERDSLTGLYNRKTFDANFTKMLSYSDVPGKMADAYEEAERREQQPSRDQWLAVFDIDHFKKVNDEFGHLYGDEVLILFANLMKSSFRARDRLFRFGGEEFIVLLRAVSLNNARMVLERFRQRVAVYPFPQVGHVSVSVGFVRLSGESPVVTLGRADQALYQAKAGGRNRVCFYDDLVEQGVLPSEYAGNSVEFF